MQTERLTDGHNELVSLFAVERAPFPGFVVKNRLFFFFLGGVVFVQPLEERVLIKKRGDVSFFRVEPK